jgi:hypothetical protein
MNPTTFEEESGAQVFAGGSYGTTWPWWAFVHARSIILRVKADEKSLRLDLDKSSTHSCIKHRRFKRMRRPWIDATREQRPGLVSYGKTERELWCVGRDVAPSVFHFQSVHLFGVP